VTLLSLMLGGSRVATIRRGCDIGFAGRLRKVGRWPTSRSTTTFIETRRTMP
jgi:hypothetical protein